MHLYFHNFDQKYAQTAFSSKYQLSVTLAVLSRFASNVLQYSLNVYIFTTGFSVTFYLARAIMLYKIVIVQAISKMNVPSCVHVAI